MHDLKNKVVLITGAASGLGAGVVRQLMEEGVKHAAILDVAKDAGEAFEKEMNAKYGANKAKFYQCDVTNEEALLPILADVKSKQGYIDLVINNAGIMNDSWPVFRKEILVNVLAPVTISLRALEMMRRDEGGRGGTIINISSVAALSQGSAALPVYGATKTAVLQFSNMLGRDEYYSRTGVRVITICPGSTDTALCTPQKMGFVDKASAQIAVNLFSNMSYQKIETAASGIIETYKRGESGSTWVVAKNESPKDISDDIKKFYAVLNVHAQM